MAKLMTKQEFINQLVQKKRTDVVLLGDYVNMTTKTLFGCTKEDCKHEWLAKPNTITMGSGCPVCANRKLVSNINSVAVLRPDLICYFDNPDDAYSITLGSHKIVTLRCPDCGAVKTMQMYNLSFEGFNCTKCNANISYPNRLIRSVMRQLTSQLDALEYEWSQKWTHKQRYDVYFEYNKQKYVIEMQGIQHFIAGWKKNRSLEEIQKKDAEKYAMAIAHDIIPIIIDSRKSEFDFIFCNIKDSILGQLFNLDNVDTQRCQIDITSNIIKQVCEQFNNSPNIGIKNLANQFCVSDVTITKYLKTGSKIGWCNYIPGDLYKSKVIVLDANHTEIGRYNSIRECASELSRVYNVKFFNSNISRACQKGYSCNGLFFTYA